MSEELKPCPFACKEDLIFTEQRDCADGYAHGYTIFCPSCGIDMHDEYKDDLVSRWNTRTERNSDE